MRQLTVGVSESSPHVIQPIFSNSFTLHLLNCFFIGPVRQASYAHFPTDPAINIPTFDQLASYHGDEKDAQCESQDQSPFDHRTKNY
jgi:hypothetical protein